LKDGSEGLAKIAPIKAELAAGKGIRRIARDLGCRRGVSDEGGNGGLGWLARENAGSCQSVP
jgi:hypothetical protein